MKYQCKSTRTKIEVVQGIEDPPSISRLKLCEICGDAATAWYLDRSNVKAEGTTIKFKGKDLHSYCDRHL